MSLLGLGVCTLLFIILFPIDNLLIRDLEDRFSYPKPLPAKVDGIVVLGGTVDQFITASRGAVAINGSVERIFEFARLSKLYPSAKLVFTGGSGMIGKQKLKEAHFIKPILKNLSVDPERVIYEDKSRNTYENAIFSKKIVKPMQQEKWFLITSAFHMPRAVGVFRAAGWNVIPFPVDYMTEKSFKFKPSLNLRNSLNGVSIVLHEWLGLLFYWCMGYIDTFYPEPDY
jgi:uncharacterized SAM-binding protein YcdF (DUF218 family)